MLFWCYLSNFSRLWFVCIFLLWKCLIWFDMTIDIFFSFRLASLRLHFDVIFWQALCDFDVTAWPFPDSMCTDLKNNKMSHKKCFIDKLSFLLTAVFNKLNQVVYCENFSFIRIYRVAKYVYTVFSYLFKCSSTLLTYSIGLLVRNFSPNWL